jgi:hypothetical protein
VLILYHSCAEMDQRPKPELFPPFATIRSAALSVFVQFLFFSYFIFSFLRQGITVYSRMALNSGFLGFVFFFFRY